jgi:hypothetical protein
MLKVALYTYKGFMQLLAAFLLLASLLVHVNFSDVPVVSATAGDGAAVGIPDFDGVHPFAGFLPDAVIVFSFAGVRCCLAGFLVLAGSGIPCVIAWTILLLESLLCLGLALFLASLLCTGLALLLGSLLYLAPVRLSLFI